VPVKEARRLLIRDEANKLVDFDEVIDQAIERAEQSGVVFIDELDKIAGPRVELGSDVSGEGVQRDLLPIVEGSTVITRYGPVRTDHVLFIGAGAFYRNKPSDLIPELQGRFPLRVELASLTRDDFRRILVETDNSLIRQTQSLLATEGVELQFTTDAIDRIADIAYTVNDTTENIGARRLQTVVERILEDISFDAPTRTGEVIVVDSAYVDQQVKHLVKDDDLARYIL
jgi:ATP-dependent HslUV protease ATP-binding subunit HslU